MDTKQEYWKRRFQTYAHDDLNLSFNSRIARTMGADKASCVEITYALANTCNHSVISAAAKLGTNPCLVYVTAYAVLLSKYFLQEDLVFGISTDGVAQVPFRCHLSADTSISTLVQSVNALWHNDCANYQNDFVPLLVSEGKVQLGFGYFTDSSPRVLANECSARMIELEINDVVDHCQVRIRYCEERFDKDFIFGFFQHFCNILNLLVESPGMQLQEVCVLSRAERDLQLTTWNQTVVPFEFTPVHILFERQVAETPTRIALTLEDATMTYAELNHRANGMAHILKHKGIGPNMLVGIGTERSFELIIGILAIQKAGAAYVPLDVTYPDDRLIHMLSDTKVPILLTQSHLLPKWQRLASSVCELIIIEDSIYTEKCNGENLISTVHGDHAAYVIYTSGSTGLPKGVVISQRSLFIICNECKKFKNINVGSHMLQFFSVNFDPMVEEWTSALTSGAILCMLSSQYPVLEAMQRVLKKYPIEIMALTPSVLKQFSEADLPYIKTISVGGEVLDEPLFLRWRNNCRFINLYGPTESTVIATMRICDAQSPWPHSCIGRPIGNRQVYILDKYKQLMPVGLPGELYIGGEGLAIGYLNRTELTNEKFIWHSFDADSQPVRLYATGDLVRYFADGNIDFLGRIDTQIKIRGFRVELGEIEAQLIKQSKVTDAVVVAQGEGSNKKLVSFLVAPAAWSEDNSEQQAFIDELKSNLSSILPPYMVPSQMKLLKSLPLTINNKIDRKYLQSIKVEEASCKDTVKVAPSTEIELQLAETWCAVLNISGKQVGIHDDFFEHGGNSILVIQFISQLKTLVRKEITTGQFYQGPTIAMLAKVIASGSSSLDPCFLPIVTHLDKPVLFLVHEIYGFTMDYKNNLSSPWTDKFSIYGLSNLFDSNGDIRRYESIEELAKTYIGKMRQIAPKGPYHLGGWSSGGEIAAEVAYQFQCQGETVETLLLFDPIFARYVDLVEAFEELFPWKILTKLKVNPEEIPKIVQLTKHTNKLLQKSTLKQLKRIDCVHLIKAEGSLLSVVNDYLAGIDWRFKDMMSGMNHYFAKGQEVHIESMPCAHHFMFIPPNKPLMQKLFLVLAAETVNDAFVVNDSDQQLSIVKSKNNLYLEKTIQLETGVFESISNTGDKVRIAAQYNSMAVELIRLSESCEQHNLDVGNLISSLSLERKSMVCLVRMMLELTPRFLILAILQIGFKLAIVRICSDHSQILLNAYFMDEIIIAWMLQVAYKLMLPMCNYLSVAIFRNDSVRAGQAFDAGLWTCGILAIPWILYAIFAKSIGLAAGMNESLATSWQELAIVHSLAIVPALMGVTIEVLYWSTYNFYVQPFAFFIGAAIALLMLWICIAMDSFSGYTLGICLSAASWVQLLVYMVCLHRDKLMYQYNLFQSYNWTYIKQYVRESYLNASSSLVALTYVILVFVLASEETSTFLTAYFIALTCLNVAIASFTVVTLISSISSERWVFVALHQVAVTAGLLGIVVALLVCIIWLIPMLLLSGKELSEIFIDTNCISEDNRSTMYEVLEEFIVYFAPLLPLFAIRFPATSFLLQYRRYATVATVSFIFDLVLPVALIVLFYNLGWHSSAMFIICFVSTIGLGTVYIVYEWLRIADFFCTQMPENTIVVRDDGETICNCNCYPSFGDSGYQPIDMVDLDERDHSVVYGTFRGKAATIEEFDV